MVLIDLEFDPRCSQGLPGAGKFGIEGRLPVTGHRIPHLAQGVAGDVLDQAEEKPSGTGNFLTPVAIHDVLAEASEKVNFDWPHSLPIERIKAGLTEIAVAILLFAGLVAICLQRF